MNTACRATTAPYGSLDFAGLVDHSWPPAFAPRHSRTESAASQFCMVSGSTNCRRRDAEMAHKKGSKNDSYQHA